MNRRGFMSVGLACAAGAASGTLSLAAAAQPTPVSGDIGEYDAFLERHGLLVAQAPQIKLPASQSLVLPATTGVTEDNILGPYFRANAPTRYTITSPYETGTVMLISGRVWAFDTKKPIPGAVLHIWQADEHGRYENDQDPDHPPAEFVNRGIIFTDATGAYEYQTIHPGRYLNGRQYRPAHIHYKVEAPGYRTLVTQLYFDGDPYNVVDPFIKRSLIINLANAQRKGKTYERGVFDIVLRPIP